MIKHRIPLGDARRIANSLVSDLKKYGATRIEIVGSIRRQVETVGDIDVIAIFDDSPAQLLLKVGAEVATDGDKQAFGLYQGVPVNLWKTVTKSWGAALFSFTGPKKYGIAYRSIAKRKGLLLNQYGLLDAKGKQIAGETESSIYEALGKTYKPPQMRGL